MVTLIKCLRSTESTQRCEDNVASASYWGYVVFTPPGAVHVSWSKQRMVITLRSVHLSVVAFFQEWTTSMFCAFSPTGFSKPWAPKQHFATSITFFWRSKSTTHRMQWSVNLQAEFQYRIRHQSKPLRLIRSEHVLTAKCRGFE